jgi:uncharacterized protein DUF5615
VRVLLDEHLPRRLVRELHGHDVRTVQQQGWAGLRNGELLRRAGASGFEIFITADQGLQFQQNLATATFALIVLSARSNRLDDLLPLVPGILAEIGNARPGEVRRVASG